MLSGSTLNSLTNVNSLRKYVIISFLNKASITLPADVKTRVCEIEAQVVNYLQRLGMKETEIFGLALRIDDEFVFVDGENKLTKYASRQWKISSNGFDNVGNPLLKFQYRVKYYLNSCITLRDQVSRLHYYLQLRENVLNYNQDLQEDEIFGLVSLALQADLGDFNSDIHTSHYFDPAHYFPQWILLQMGVSYVLERIRNFHQKLFGLSTCDAQAQFIQEASLTDSPHNVHLYQLRRKKHDPSTQVAVSISDKGIGIYEEERINSKCSKKLIQSFLWSNIEDLSFDKKKFEIRAACYSGKLTFFTSSDEKSKHLLQLCRLTHQFSRNQRWRTSESFRSSIHDGKSREDFLCSEGSQFEKREFVSSFGSYMEDSEENVERVSPLLNSSSNTTSGIVSDKNLAGGETQDLEREREVGSSTEHSIENGAASVTMSLAAYSQARPVVLSHDDDLSTSMLQHTPPGSPDISSLNWEGNSKLENSIFGRSSSIHSSSSQHSVSTVRSRYSFVPSRHRHELALGAQLADLSLAPDLPDLADFPSMAARGDETADNMNHAHSKSHNCCSTCCDDNASLASEEADSEREDEMKNMCRCGSCSSCLCTSLPNRFDNMRLYLSFENPEKPCQQIFPSSHLFTDNDSLVAQPDLDDTIGSTYNFSEEDFNQLDNNDDYVEFYKRGIRYYGQQSTLDRNESTTSKEVVFLNLSSSSDQNINSIQEGCLPHQVLLSKKISPVEEELLLDYSVESAQGMLTTSCSSNNSESLWSHLMDTQDTKSKKRITQPFPVSMSKVTTVTPVSIASSRFSLSPASPDMKENFNESSLPTSGAVTLEISNSTEAPAKFITSKPRIAVLTAQTQLASTAAPSFTSVPLTRAKIHTLPQVQYRSKSDAIQSLQRVMLPNPKPLKLLSPYNKKELSFIENRFPDPTPVIQANNYLDVHASSNLNKERLRTHPEKLPSKTPRSLFLKNQKKKLHRESIQNKHHMEQLHQQLLDETVYQPAAYAQGVGVPLKPSPKYTRCRSSKVKNELKSSCFEKSSIPQQNMLISHNIGHSCNTTQKHCYHFQHQSDQNELEVSHQNAMYQPNNNRNIFQNPTLSMVHPVYGISFCPTDQIESVNADILMPYQCTSDPGLYPHSNEQQSLATVYTNQVTQSQIEQFKAQLNSDTDYVIYPHKDPAISRQEYMDAKQSQFIASNAQKQGNICGPMVLDQVPPYKSSKSCSLYRSAPNVAGSFATSSFLSSYPSYQSLASQGSTHQPGSSSGYSSMARGRYFSQQSLASSFSSVPSTYSASTQSLTGSFDPYSETTSIPKSPSAVVRVRSDESILSSSGGLTEGDPSLGSLHISNIPSRPPPLPYRHKEVLDNCRDGTKATFSRGVNCNRSRSQPRVTLQQVRERGYQLDVPLLSALCSDSSLLMQRNPRSPPQKGHRLPKFSKSSGEPFHPSSSAEVLPSGKATLMKHAKSDTLQDKYCSLSGLYTTNQIPAPPHLSPKVSNFKNGVHQHPKVKCKTHSKYEMASNSRHGSCSRLKQSRSTKEKRENQNL